jgi:hypothetical protein
MQRGYADILGDDDPTGAGVGQRAMISGVVPRLYERMWRPVLAPLLMAGRRDERAMALEMLAIEPGDSVLDVVRVLAPGGRIALLASVARGPLPAGAVDAVVRRTTGTRVFGPDELTGALAERGLTAIARRLAGMAQFVSARSPR